LSHAWVYYGVCPLHPSSITEAVQMVAQTLRAADGNAARAIRFIKYQELGPAGADGIVGTGDDVENPLAGFRPKREVVETEAPDPDEMAEASKLRDAGYEALLDGDSELALRCFKRAYSVACVYDRAFDRALEDIGVALKAVDGNLVRVRKFFQYQLYGPNGADGKAGTPDDLEDPLGEG